MEKISCPNYCSVFLSGEIIGQFYFEDPKERAFISNGVSVLNKWLQIFVTVTFHLVGFFEFFSIEVDIGKPITTIKGEKVHSIRHSWSCNVWANP